MSLSLTSRATEAEVMRMVRELAPSAELVAADRGTFKFKLPCEETSVDRVFAALAAARQQRALGLLSDEDVWNVSSTTLEEVFLQVVAATADPKPPPLAVHH